VDAVTAATVQVGQFSWELTPVSAIFAAVIFVLYIIAAFDGMKFVFRGTRDYLSTGHEYPTVMARFGGTVAAICVFLSGGVLFVAVIGWLAGAGFFTQKPMGPQGREERAMEKFETPLRSPSD
jgi:hypothetical protein